MGTAGINFVYRKQCFSCQAKHVYRCWAVEPVCWQVDKTVPTSWDCLLFYKLIIAWNTRAFKVAAWKYVLDGWKHYFLPLCVEPNRKIKEETGIVFCPGITAPIRSLAISTVCIHRQGFLLPSESQQFRYMWLKSCWRGKGEGEKLICPNCAVKNRIGFFYLGTNNSSHFFLWMFKDW